jgi:hypothetical protein
MDPTMIAAPGHVAGPSGGARTAATTSKRSPWMASASRRSRGRKGGKTDQLAEWKRKLREAMANNESTWA